MLIATIIMGLIALTLFTIAYRRGSGEHIAGLKAGGKILLNIAPLLLFAFMVAGLIQVVIPTETISEWVGAESGIRGIIIGSFIGGLLPGGPFTSLPIAAGLLQTGAGIGTMVALITAWSLWAVSRLPVEVGLMGWRFTLIRITVTFFFPIIAGLLANILFSGVELFN